MIFTSTTAPSIGAKTGGARLRVSWWLASLLLHALIVGLLFFLVPRQKNPDAVNPSGERAPAVNRDVLESTTRKIEQKQSAEMARKLRELERLAASIKNSEATQRRTHTAFEAAFVQITPELAGDLSAQATERLHRLDELIQSDLATWRAAEKALSTATPRLHPDQYAGLKHVLASLEPSFLKLSPSQHALNFGQAALFEVQRQIADRLAFIKTEIPDLAAQQATLATSWETVMSLGADYAKHFQPLTDLFGGSIRIVDGIIQNDRSIRDRETKLSTCLARLAKYETELGPLRDSLAKLQEAQGKLTPADGRRARQIENEIKRLNEAIGRLDRAIENEKKEEAFLTRLLGESQSSRQARLRELGERLAAIRPAFDALSTARGEYWTRLHETISQQNALEPAMRAALPPGDRPPAP